MFRAPQLCLTRASTLCVPRVAPSRLSTHVAARAVPRVARVTERSFAAPRSSFATLAARWLPAQLRSRMSATPYRGSHVVPSSGMVVGVARRMFSSGKAGGNSGKESLVDMYLRWLAERPILTKCVTSGIISFLGDVACQLAIDEGGFSIRRCFNMTVLGTFLVGPGLHFWYGRLAALIPGTTTGAVLGRLALDQLVWAPIFIAMFFSAMSLLQGKPEAILPNLKQNVWNAMIVNWQLWPAANFVNFKFVPVHLQVLFANFVALIWNSYLSWATSRDVVIEEVAEGAAADASA